MTTMTELDANMAILTSTVEAKQSIINIIV